MTMDLKNRKIQTIILGSLVVIAIAIFLFRPVLIVPYALVAYLVLRYWHSKLIEEEGLSEKK